VSAHRIDDLSAPLLVTWQLTRDCDLACLHCCTDSAPGKRLADELTRDEALRLCDDLVSSRVPYVMLCGGEPMVVPHFMEIAESLGSRGAGSQDRDQRPAPRSRDGAAARGPARALGPGKPRWRHAGRVCGPASRGSLEKAHAACRAIHDAGLALEITFAPTQINIDEAEAVIARARALGAFRFNSGRLMRIGTAARHWARVEPSEAQYAQFRALLAREAAKPGLEICHEPFSMQDGLALAVEEPPATLLVLPNGWVKVAAALPHICADLRKSSFGAAWEAYKKAWSGDTMVSAVRDAIRDESRHGQANSWRLLAVNT
jgi:MoaA/NifB/PqqE/SkfB family radical SAM enzyme